MLFLTKTVRVAGPLSGLISIPSYTAIASGSNDEPSDSTGDTQEYRIFEGQAPTMQPSDAGMATNAQPGEFEWRDPSG